MSYAVIGGSGLYHFEELENTQKLSVDTPYGDISDEIVKGEYAGKTVYFLPRHGEHHQIPPHKVNYRANLWALKQLGVTEIIAVNAVGGIADNLKPGDIVIPDQIIDYTYGREHTFSDGTSASVEHIDFTHPFDESLRQKLVNVIDTTPGSGYFKDGVYGCTQGPRLETAAEIRRLKNDGCTLVGMTAMPEAALARELGLAYVAINIVANMAAGLTTEVITFDDISRVVKNGTEQIRQLIKNTLERE